MAARLNMLFPDMERFVDQGKHALKSGIQATVDTVVSGVMKIGLNNNK